MKKNTVTGFLLLALSLGTGFSALAQTPEQRAKIISRYDQVKAKELIQEYAERQKSQKAEALRLAELNGWPVTIKKEDGTFMELMRVENGNPVYYKTFNAGSAAMMGVDQVHTGGGEGLDLNGQGMNIGIWDGGAVNKFHQDLMGRVTQKDGVTSVDNHATHVAGTMVGSGEGDLLARGMAYQATIQANDWNSDETEMVTQASQDALLISNHSYGRDAGTVGVSGFGAYNSSSASWDNMTYNFPYYQPVVAAGNDRDAEEPYNPAKNGRDLLFDQAVSKNVVVVGAIYEYGGTGLIESTSFSNWGPTDDSRVKPDIVTKGYSVYSTWGAGNDDYEAISGTSMASPGIAGGLLLLQQHYGELHDDFMRSATLRGLMVHTSDEGGTALGPDYKFGWGVLNVKDAVTVITEDNEEDEEAGALILEATLSNSASYSQNIIASGNEPLTVTLAWTDPAGTLNSNPALVNDLDVRVTKDGVEYFPWRLNPFIETGVAQQLDNNVDNVEKIQLLESGEILIPEAGENYTVTITHKGSLLGGSQDYSLIISGIDGSTNGIGENEFLSEINMWPNPANDVLNVSFSNVIGNELNAVIYDIQGRKVAQKDLILGTQNTIDISAFQAGIYIVEFSNGVQKSTKKLLKK